MAENDVQRTVDRAVADLGVAASMLAVPLAQVRTETEAVARSTDGGSVLSRSGLLDLLGSEVARLRVAAMRLLSLPPNPLEGETLRRIAHIANTDPDPCVRGVAWDALLMNHSKISDRDLSELVLAIGQRCADSEIKPSADVQKEMVTRANTLRAWLEKDDSFESRASALRHDIWRGIAGTDITPLLQQRDVALEWLRSEQPERRAVAIAVLVEHWNCAAEYRDLWISLIASETEPKVRERLVAALGTAFEASEDHQCLSVLATIVLSETEAAATRSDAYRAMLRVAGCSGSADPVWSDVERPNQLRVPADVDLDFVRRWA